MHWWEQKHNGTRWETLKGTAPSSGNCDVHGREQLAVKAWVQKPGELLGTNETTTAELEEQNVALLQVLQPYEADMAKLGARMQIRL